MNIVLVTTGRDLHKETLAALDRSGPHPPVRIIGADAPKHPAIKTPEQDLIWRNILALKEPVGPVLVLEDDLLFCKNFGERTAEISAMVEPFNLVVALFVWAPRRPMLVRRSSFANLIDYPAHRFVGTQAMLWSSAAARGGCAWLAANALRVPSWGLDTALRSYFWGRNMLFAFDRDLVQHRQQPSLMPTSDQRFLAGAFEGEG